MEHPFQQDSLLRADMVEGIKHFAKRAVLHANVLYLKPDGSKVKKECRTLLNLLLDALCVIMPAA